MIYTVAARRPKGAHRTQHLKNKNNFRVSFSLCLCVRWDVVEPWLFMLQITCALSWWLVAMKHLIFRENWYRLEPSGPKCLLRSFRFYDDVSNFTIDNNCECREKSMIVLLVIESNKIKWQKNKIYCIYLIWAMCYPRMFDSVGVSCFPFSL
jgi:hypothetical protein